MWQQPGRQFRRGTRAEGTEPELVLQFNRMALTIPFHGKVFVDGLWKSVDLRGDERDKGRRRPLVGLQGPARMAKVAEHKRIAETVLIATAAPDHGEVRGGQRVMAHQLALISWRIEQRGEQGSRQNLPARHSGLLGFEASTPADPGQRVDQGAAFDAEGAANCGLGGPAIKGRNHRRELLRIDGRRAASSSPAPLGGGNASLHPLLGQGSLELCQRAKDVEQKLALRGSGVHPLGE